MVDKAKTLADSIGDFLGRDRPCVRQCQRNRSTTRITNNQIVILSERRTFSESPSEPGLIDVCLSVLLCHDLSFRAAFES